MVSQGKDSARRLTSTSVSFARWPADRGSSGGEFCVTHFCSPGLDCTVSATL
jgi:hypothetical protein